MNNSMKRTKEEISYNMSKIKGKDTKPEMLLRRTLYKRGLRYNIHAKDLEGHPDIVFRKQRVVVFVDGDFWHGRDWTERKEDIKSNRAYWIPKIEKNISRDNEENIDLEKQGYQVIRLWETEIEKDPERCADIVKETLDKAANPYFSD
jgi:DNA mismatch endonuclease (patch repair protein)